MQFVCFQHPAVWLLFAISALAAMLSQKFDFPAALASALCGIGGILAALICSVPTEEILLLLLLPLLCAIGKGEKK